MDSFYVQSFWIVLFSFNICGVTPFLNFDYNSNDENSSDVHRNTSQLLQNNNYIAEEHTVITKDGYVLKTFRIPRNGTPVLLVHGICDSSDSWVVLGPKYSLAYLLADAGYDVWLFNSRGNKYSKGHAKRLSRKVYWDFSYEEVGTQDVPATIDYILSITRHSKLTYIGFSQGTTVFFVMCSMLPEYNSMIDHAILLAPVAWMKYVKYPFMGFFSRNLNALTSFDKKEMLYEIFSTNEKRNNYHAIVCKISSPLKILCQLEFYVNYGLKKFTNLLQDRLPVISSHIPAGTSTKTFFHFLQGYLSNRFQRFDYGAQRNQRKYSSPLPPEYNVSSISVPISLIASEVDWYADIDDVYILKSRLKTVDKFVLLNESVQFTHLEFVYGSRVNSIINRPVIDILETLKYR